jgi:hypothetical protein
MGYKEDMAEYAEQWDEAKLGGNELKEGVYQAKIAIARVEQSQFNDEWQFFVVFEDLGGSGSQPMWYNLQHEVGAALAKRVTRDLGWEGADQPGALLELPEVCAAGFFEDLVVEIRVKDKPGDERVFKQVFINKLLGKGEPGQVAVAATGDSDDIPF